MLAEWMWDRCDGKCKVATRACRFEGFAAKWVEAYCGLQHWIAGMKPSILRSYRDCPARHITPFFGKGTFNDIGLPR